MDDKIRPRLLHTDDTDALDAFFGSLTDREAFYFYPHPLDRANAERLTATVGDGTNIRLVAVLGTQIVGYAHLDSRRDPAVATMGICVKPENQSRGLGTRLLSALLDRARRKGLQEVILTVHTDNLRALKLYQRMGFRKEETFINRRQNVPQYRMRLHLRTGEMK